MKRKSQRLDRVSTVAAFEEHRQRQDMGRAQNLLDAEVTRLAELVSYRQSYAKKHGLVTNIKPSHWADYQYFLQRLDKAVSMQRQHVLTGEQNREAHRKRWMAKRQKRDSLDRVINRYRKAEAESHARQIQKELDDRPLMDNLYAGFGSSRKL